MRKHSEVKLGYMEEVLKGINEEFDLCVTSPPYADKRKNAYGGISAKDYAAWLLKRSDLIMDKLKDTGSFVLNIKEGASGGVRETYVNEYLMEMSRRYRWVETFIWVKTNPFPTGNRRRLKDAFEYCYQFCKTKDYKFFPEHCMVPADQKWAADNKRRKNKGQYTSNNGSNLSMSIRTTSDWARPSNVISFPCHTKNTAHCAAFPLNLPSFFIKLLTDEEDMVLDPFVGSGTTILAAEKLNRTAIGIEKEEKYWKIAKKRLEEIYDACGKVHGFSRGM